MPQGDLIPVYLVTAEAGRTFLPQALGMIHAYARTYQGGRLMERIEFSDLLRGPDAEWVRQAKPGIWLFSDYSWTVFQNLDVSRLVKEVNPRNITIHGGPSVPKYQAACERFLRDESHVDIAVRGEGEVVVSELLDQLSRVMIQGGDWREAVKDIEGLSYLSAPGSGEMLRTPDRPRLQNLDELPSPFLDGTFDKWTSPKIRTVVLETNRGCPYRCTYCDWGSATAQKIYKFDLERVKAEIDWMAANKVQFVFIADANYGIFERDLEIAQHIAAVHQATGYPREVNVSYAKNGNERIPEIVRTLVEAGITTQAIISIQTVDEATLEAVGRRNIRTENYQKLANTFRELGLPISTDIMLGLPGSTLKAHKLDLQFFFDEDIISRVFRTMVLPNSPMGDPAYQKQHGIETAPDKFIRATATFPEQDMNRASALSNLYEVAEKASLLRYITRYLQWEFGYPGIEFMDRLLVDLHQRPDHYPAYLQGLDRARILNGVAADPHPFYNATWKFARDVLNLPVETANARAVWLLNASLMPNRKLQYPVKLEAIHDFAGYFQDGRAPAPGEERKLQTLPQPVTFEVSDPEGYARMDFETAVMVNNALTYFELDWPGKKSSTNAALY